jgi:fatty-acid desaturase
MLFECAVGVGFAQAWGRWHGRDGPSRRHGSPVISVGEPPILDYDTYERAVARRAGDAVGVGELMRFLRIGVADLKPPRDKSKVSAINLAGHGVALVIPRLQVPAGVKPDRITWPWAIAIGTYHLLALLAFAPWFFSRTGVVVALLGFYVFGVLGINIGFHRLLAHRGFSCPKWLEHLLAIFGVCSLQGSPAFWVAAHRRHHQHSDEQPDPHSPLVNFFWAHMGWLLVETGVLAPLGWKLQYAKDLLHDPFYEHLERSYVWVALGSWIGFFIVGVAGGFLIGESSLQALQLGASLLLWGVIVRTIVVWHITWSVNSVTHLWGYRNYESDENSRNNVVIGILAAGEGWHNNHHADQRAAKHGHLWWEVDGTYLTIRLLAALGLVKDIVMPNAGLAAARARRQG